MVYDFITGSSDGSKLVNQTFRSYQKMCPGLHDTVITKHVPWGVPGRAYLTVPEGFDLYKSAMPKAGLGIHATTFIKKWTWLGEYDGEIVLPEDGGSISAYTWKVSTSNFHLT